MIAQITAWFSCENDSESACTFCRPLPSTMPRQRWERADGQSATVSSQSALGRKSSVYGYVRPQPGRGRPHVMLSTKQQEPWFSISKRITEWLERECDCTVYNPNTDNAASEEEETSDEWLSKFKENLEIVKQSKGFVLQIQQHIVRDESDKLKAEEMQSEWYSVPRIGIFSYAGGSSKMLANLRDAVERAKKQWQEGITKELEIASEVYEGSCDMNGDRHGWGTVRWPDGTVYEGEFRQGMMHGRGAYRCSDGSRYEGEYQDSLRHGKGSYRFRDASVYEGEFQNDKRHGLGVYRYRSGAVEVGFYADDQESGPSVLWNAARNKTWLQHNGKCVSAMTLAEAAAKAHELGFEVPQ